MTVGTALALRTPDQWVRRGPTPVKTLSQNPCRFRTNRVSVDLLFKKYFYAIVLLIVALAAYFQASGVSSLIESQLAPGSGPTFPPMLQARVTSFERPNVTAIHNRNPFDSVTGPLNAVAVVLPTAQKKELNIDDPLSVPVCAGVKVFIVTESSDPLWSFAAVQGNGDPGPKLRRVGDAVSGQKVAYIGFNPRANLPTIWLEGDSLCQASLFGEAGGAPAPPAPAAVEGAEGEGEEPATKGTASAIDPDIKSKIRKISETEYEIDRSAVEKILEDQAQLMRSARIVPEQKDGKTIGVRLFGVRPDTLLGTLGLKNGDRLEQINGFDMGSPEKALEAYARLRTAENLKIKLNRRGTDTTIDFKIK